MSRLPPRLAVVLGALVLAVPAAAQPTPDHLACFKVKDHARPATYSFSLTNAAGTQKCVAKLPAKFGCFESAESNVVPTPPGGGPSPGPAVGAVLCYQTKCKRPFTPTAEMADQFGARMVVFKGAQFMCAPANRGASRRRARQPRCHPSRAVLPMASAKDSAARAGCARRRRRAARASAGRRA